MEASLVFQVLHGCMDGAIESGDVGEGLVGQTMRLEVEPDKLFERVEGMLADVDRPLSSTSTADIMAMDLGRCGALRRTLQRPRKAADLITSQAWP